MRNEEKNMSPEIEANGFVHLKGLLPTRLIARLARNSAYNLQRASADHRAANRAQGSMISIATDPAYSGLISCPELLDGLASQGFADLRYQSGFLISKPGHSPALFWHQDWWGWSHPSAYEPMPPQLGIMIYLGPTTVKNGCLRVVPGTHLRRHPLHDSITAHARALSRVDDPRHKLFQSADGEIALPSSPGDVFVVDARLLHAAYPNRTDQERMLLTLWYHPAWSDLPNGVRVHAANVFDGAVSDLASEVMPSPRNWPTEALENISALVPEHPGGQPVEFNRNPDTGKMEAMFA